jgi:YD repeat-containing protein
VTTWNYHSQSGWLLDKRYPDSTGPDYSYTLGGRLKTRDWARIGTGSQRVRTTYAYGFEGSSKHGDLTQVTYSNDPAGTPQITYNYNRLGQRSSVVRAGTTTSFTYNFAGRTTVETHSGGILGGLNTIWIYDNRLRPHQMRVRQSTTVLGGHNYGYDGASRLLNVTNVIATANRAAYNYVADSSLVGQITFRQNTTDRMTTTRQHDFLNRLESISSAPSAEPLPLAYNYVYNNANQRIRTTLADGSFWVYEYDTLGQANTANTGSYGHI